MQHQSDLGSLVLNLALYIACVLLIIFVVSVLYRVKTNEASKYENRMQKILKSYNLFFSRDSPHLAFTKKIPKRLHEALLLYREEFMMRKAIHQRKSK